jgi:carboxymethylenebutenolidase
MPRREEEERWRVAVVIGTRLRPRIRLGSAATLTPRCGLQASLQAKSEPLRTPELGSVGVCFELDSLPPIPPVRGAAVSHEDLVLEARDGNKLAAFEGTPEEPTEVAVVILPDVRGLYRFYEELALRFAERGIAAVAIDYFGRTAGLGKRGDEFEYMPHVERTTPEGIQADVAAAVEHLRTQGARTIFTVGFCFGGRNSWLSAAGGHDLAGAIGFYGRPGTGRDGTPGPTERAQELDAPILALQAGADQNITAEDNAAFDHALSAAGVEHELFLYDGAPHSFFDRSQAQFAEASEDAWKRVLEFIGRHSRELAGKP